MTYFEAKILEILEQHAGMFRTYNEEMRQLKELVSSLCNNATTDAKLFEQIHTWAAGCQEGFIGHEKILTIIVDALVNHRILRKEKPKEETMN